MVRAGDDVAQAKVAIRELLCGDLDRTWTIREVQDSLTGWRGTIVSLALLDMRRTGELEMGDDFAVRVRALSTS